MRIDHHPNDELLLDYTTGSLGESWSLAIATHLALCPVCRHRVAALETIGGDMMEALEPVVISASSRDAVFARLDDEPTLRAPVKPVANDSTKYDVPEPLRSYVGGSIDDLPWQKLGLGVHQLMIDSADPSTARLLRVPAGKPVPEHTHRGREFTLVLSGGFSDSTGHYGIGDFQEGSADLLHQPHADRGEDCICLAVTDAPLQFSNFAFRLVQPFIGI